MDAENIICKQDVPLLASHSTDDCEVMMLQPIRIVPKTCNQRILDLKETLWIPLKENSWIYVAPKPNQLTVLCPDQAPTDIEITNSGILTFLADCTSYGDRVMIRSITSHLVNDTQKDIIPALHLPFDCCETSASQIHLDELQLETPLKNILTHNEELRLASYKIYVQKLIEEQEWKLKHSNKTYQVSVLSATGAAVLAFLIGIACCWCRCRCCRNCWVKFMKRFCDGDRCSSIVFRPKIINSLHTSSDSLHRRAMALSLTTKVEDGISEHSETSELTPMKVSTSPRIIRISNKHLAVGKR
jgi:hypothetical protein